MNQTFQSEVEFLRAHGLNPIVLGNDEGARLVTLAEYQGRVMTSTMAGDGGAGCGWINRALIASGKRMPHINAYGGEDDNIFSRLVLSGNTLIEGDEDDDEGGVSGAAFF